MVHKWRQVTRCVEPAVPHLEAGIPIIQATDHAAQIGIGNDAGAWPTLAFNFSNCGSRYDVGAVCIFYHIGNIVRNPGFCSKVLPAQYRALNLP